ncbi:MAG: Bro-N domain-containing protein [Bacteroidota bacterium]
MSNIKLFETKKVRTFWDENHEKWYFSIVDVVGVLTDNPNPNNYWKVLKHRLTKEGSELVTNCNQLKMMSSDGKYYLTDVADTEQLLRLIQSVPSPKAEPFKQWLAMVGYERIEETEDPEKTFDRAMETYLRKGYSKEWINQRLKSIEVRKELTDEWENRNVKKGQEFAILTDEITRAWSGFTTKEYKKFKDLKKENLRDNMTNLELVLNMLAEATTTEISKEKNPESFEDSKVIAKQGGKIAGDTRKAIEKKSGKKIVTKLNAKKVLKLK